MPDYEMDIDLGRQASSESTNTPFEPFYLHRFGSQVSSESTKISFEPFYLLRFGWTSVEREYESTV